MAVSFFFILSGFILAYTYLEKARAGKLVAREFWVARFARIYPAYLLSLIPGSTLLITVAKTLGGAAALGLLVAKLGMLHAWFPFTARNWNDATWSLSVEALFYLLFPLAAAVVVKMRRERIVPAMAGLFLISSAVCVARYALQIRFQNTVMGLDSAALSAYIQQLETVFARIPIFRLPEFLLGVLMGRLFLDGRDRLANMETWFLGSGAAILALLVFSRLIPDALFESFVLVPPFAIFIFSAAGAKGRVIGLLSTPSMILLGEASYSLYLMHGPVYALFRKVAHVGPVAYIPTAYLAPYLVASITVSILVYKYVEVPARRWIRSRFAHVAPKAVGE